MSVKAKVSLDKGKPVKLWAKKQSAAVGDVIHAVIVKRVSAGLSGDGGAFAPYTQAYAEEHGDRVDLRDTGRMLGGIRVRATDSGAVLEIGEGLTYPSVVDARRPFAGVTVAEADGPILDEFEEQIDKAIDKANGG